MTSGATRTKAATIIPTLVENDLAVRLSLDGDWQFSLAAGSLVPLPVPSAWEAHVRDKTLDGLALYRRRFSVPAEMQGAERLVLQFGAVSFAARVRINGAELAEHLGMWSPFQVEITAAVRPGDNELEVEVWKPGRRFPIRESLAGFLPDLATAFGGIWQSVWLIGLDSSLGDIRVVLMPGATLAVSGTATGVGGKSPDEIVIEVRGADQLAASARAAVEASRGHHFSAELDLSGLAHWRPESPTLHEVLIAAWQNGACVARASRRVGLRDIQAAAGRLRLDGRPLHLRGVLDWGWHPEQVRPTPPREAVLRQVEQTRALGFNLVKLCLFVPDEVTFQVADEVGQFLWLEMPLWLPHLTPAARSLARQEYEAVFRRLHHHASIVAISLGCELNQEADADFLAELHALAREWFPNALLCDNSGSAEAYGGVTTVLQDFYDYHFYTDPHFFRSLIDHFDRASRPPKPWLFGEFCDADTGRDFGALPPDTWWLVDPTPLDRDDFLYTRAYRARLSAAGVADGGAALTQIARRQATAVRNYVLEQTRARGATGGYVISGWADTPITTSGIVDDAGHLKYQPDEWQRFNGDAVLLLDRERRRRWAYGGDRPAYRDPFSWWMGGQAEVHLSLSNALGDIVAGRLYWRLTDAAGAELGSGGQSVEALPGAQVSELAVLRLPLPADGPRPVEMNLQADLALVLAGGRRGSVRNRWSLWAVPRPAWSGPLALAGLDRLAARHDFSRLAPAIHLVEVSDAQPSAPILAEDLTDELLARIRDGGVGLLWLSQPHRRLTRGLPFWREAIHVFEPHPLWDRVPHPGHADMRFFSVATDQALDVDALQAALGPSARCRPVWRRFDARMLTWAHYLVDVEFGRGRLWVSTLRFEGGLGRQPEGFDANPWGAWILANLLRWQGTGGT